MILRGLAADGQGKAASFTQLAWVVSQLAERLGITPHPGTFNLRLVASDQMARWQELKAFAGVPLDEPASTNCAAVCYPVVVNDQVPGAIVIPSVPAYPPDQVEVVAGESVRAALGIATGDAVTLRVLDQDVDDW